MTLLQLVWLLIFPIGLGGFSGATVSASQDQPAVVSSDEGRLPRVELLSNDADTMGDRSTLAALVSHTSEGQHVTEQESWQFKALPTPPAKAPASELEQWWREAEPGHIRLTDMQQRIPTEELLNWLTLAYQDGIAPEQIQTALQAAQWQSNSNDLNVVDIAGRGAGNGRY